MTPTDPAPPGWPDGLAAFLDRPIAHRGLHDAAAGVPENSLLAFRAAIAEGLPIELDVRRLRDDSVVVFHDPTLERLVGVPDRVARLTAGDIRTIRLAPGGEPVPLLAEALQLVAGQVPLLVELKTGNGKAGWCRAVAGTLAGYRGPVAIQSFDPLIVRWFRRHQPTWLRGLLAGSFQTQPWYQRRVTRGLWHLGLARPHFVAYDARFLPNRRVARARQRGTAVLAWTIRSAQEHERLRPLADNIIFEGFVPGAAAPA